MKVVCKVVGQEGFESFQWFPTLNILAENGLCKQILCYSPAVLNAWAESYFLWRNNWQLKISNFLMVFHVMMNTHMNAVLCVFKGEEYFKFNEEIKTVRICRQM